MDYVLDPIKYEAAARGLVIRFNTKANEEKRSVCLLKEAGNGTAFIDPGTLRLTELRLTLPHHEDPDLGDVSWFIDVKYAPVSLAAKTFWLPQTISSTSVPTELDRRTIVASFIASYGNYRKMEVHSHVFTPSESIKRQ